LDVAKILNKIILNERTEEKDWKGSQVTESVIGTPKKVCLFYILFALAKGID
jgi:hypothetical protein